MNLDKYIRIQLMMLSKEYNISIIEITSAKDGKVSKGYTIYIKNKDTSVNIDKQEFRSKRELVQYLLSK